MKYKLNDFRRINEFLEQSIDYTRKLEEARMTELKKNRRNNNMLLLSGFFSRPRYEFEPLFEGDSLTFTYSKDGFVKFDVEIINIDVETYALTLKIPSLCGHPIIKKASSVFALKEICEDGPDVCENCKDPLKGLSGITKRIRRLFHGK